MIRLAGNIYYEEPNKRALLFKLQHKSSRNFLLLAVYGAHFHFLTESRHAILLEKLNSILLTLCPILVIRRATGNRTNFWI